jgi:hypothetical protein
MASPQQRLAAVKRAVAGWWNKSFNQVTTAAPLNRYHQGPASGLLPRVNSELQKIPGFRRPLKVSDWSSINMTSLVLDVYRLSAQCF